MPFVDDSTLSHVLFLDKEFNKTYLKMKEERGEETTYHPVPPSLSSTFAHARREDWRPIVSFRKERDKVLDRFSWQGG